jgi:hypothetical protein
MAENKQFLITKTEWDPSLVTPQSLSALLHLEAVHPVLPYWSNQCERKNGFIEAFGTKFETVVEAEKSVKEKRQILIKWICDVCNSLQCHSTVFPHTIKMIDRVLACTKVAAIRLQSVGAACLFIVSKFRETTPISIQRLCQLTKGAVGADMLRDVEMVVLLKLHMDISSVTYPEFLPFLFDILASNPSCKSVPQLHHDSFRSYVTKYVRKIADLCYWAGNKHIMLIYA